MQIDRHRYRDIMRYIIQIHIENNYIEIYETRETRNKDRYKDRQIYNQVGLGKEQFKTPQIDVN